MNLPGLLLKAVVSKYSKKMKAAWRRLVQCSPPPSAARVRHYWPDTARGKLSASPSRRFLDQVGHIGSGRVQLELRDGLIAVMTVDNPGTKNSFSGSMMEQLGDSSLASAAKAITRFAALVQIR